MIKRVHKTVTAALAAAGIVLAAGPLQAQSDKTYELQIQTATPSSSLYFKLLEDFGERLSTMSAGRFDVEVLPDGAVVGAFDILDAVDNGVVEAGFAWPHYWSGKNAAYVLFSNVPASTGLDQRSLMAWFTRGGGLEMYRKLNQDIMGLNTVQFLIMPMGPDPLGWFKEPIKTMDDFRDFKYRAPPGIAGQTYKEMGVSAVAMPGGDIVPSAERGVIDAAEWIGPADDRNLGLDKIWKHYYIQGMHQATDIGELQVNKEWWDSLPKDLQAIFRSAVMATTTKTYNANILDNAEAIHEFQDRGVTVHDVPDSYFESFIKAQRKVTKEYKDQSEFFSEVLDSQSEYASMVHPYWGRVQTLYANQMRLAEEAKQSGDQ